MTTEEGELKYVIEAVLFASEKSLAPEDLKDAFEGGVSVSDIRKCLEALKKEYHEQRRGFTLLEIAGGYQLMTDERFSVFLKRFYTSREKKKLSPAGLETLSVIAYRQPVTKADIEFIRGVNVDGPLKTLLERNMVKIAGRKDVPGRPLLYGTTEEFLSHFGLNALADLPPLSEFSEKDLDPSLLPPEMKNGAILPAEVEDAAPAAQEPASQNAEENQE